MPDKRYTKVEEEIIQILDRLEDERPAPSRGHLRLVKPPRKRKRFDFGRVMSMSPLLPLFAAFGLAFLAIVFRDTSSLLATSLAVASILMFLAPIVLRRSAPTGTPPMEAKQWRGRDISFTPDSGPSPLERARRWMDERRGRPRL